MVVKKMLRSTTAASGLEYGLLLGLVGVVSIVTVFATGLELNNVFNSVDEDLTIAQGVGSGEYENFSDGEARVGINEDLCLVLTNEGDTVTQADLENAGKTCVYTLSGSDTLLLGSLSGLDVYPGLGEDSIIMSGGSGNTFTYEGGNDTYQMVVAGGNQTLKFDNLTRAQVTFSFDESSGTNNWDDFVYTTPSGTVRFEQQGRITTARSDTGGASTIVFSDQTVDIYDLKEEAILAQKSANGTTLYGTFGDDISLEPGLGNDTVFSAYGDDVITFEGGQDYYYPGAGQDVLKIPGFATTDATRYWHHSGRTWFEFGANRIGIEDQSQTDSGANVAFATIEFSDQTFTAQEFRLFVIDWQENNHSSVIGTRLNDPIEPTAVNAEVRPLGGDDTITYQAGTTFQIYSQDGGSERNWGTDTLDMSLYTSSQVTATQSGNDIVLTTPTGAVTITDQVKHALGTAPTLNIESVLFSDTSWDEAAIRSAAGVP